MKYGSRGQPFRTAELADHRDFQAWWHIWLHGCLIILAVICLMQARNAKALNVWNVLTHGGVGWWFVFLSRKWEMEVTMSTHFYFFFPTAVNYWYRKTWLVKLGEKHSSVHSLISSLNGNEVFHFMVSVICFIFC